jgi:SnoaL-like domain
MSDNNDLEIRIAKLEARVRDLEDDRAIRDLLARYAFTADNCKDDAFVNLFTEDAEVSVTAPPRGDTDRAGKGVLTWRGKGELQKFIGDPLNHHRPGRYGKWMHAQGNNLVTHIHGDEAVANSYSVVFLSEEGEVKLVSAGNNHWVFERIDGRWLIKERRRREIGDEHYTGNLDATPE